MNIDFKAESQLGRCHALAVALLLAVLTSVFISSKPASAFSYGARNTAEQFLVMGDYGPCSSEKYFTGPNWGNQSWASYPGEGFFDHCGWGEQANGYGQNLGVSWIVGEDDSKYTTGSGGFPTIGTVKAGDPEDWYWVKIYASAYGDAAGGDVGMVAHDSCSSNFWIQTPGTVIRRGSKGAGWGWANSSQSFAWAEVKIPKTTSIGRHAMQVCVTAQYYDSWPQGDSYNRWMPVFYDVIPAWEVVGENTIDNTSHQSENITASVNSNNSSDVYVKATPGDRLCWWWRVRNVGTGSTGSNFETYNYRTGWPGGSGSLWNANDYDLPAARINWTDKWNISAGGSTGQFGCYDWGQQTTFPSSYSSYTVSQADVDYTLCQRLRYGKYYDGEWFTSGSGGTPYACARVPYEYTVTPVTTNSQTEVNVGEVVNFDYSLSNSGPTKSRAMDYKAYVFVLRAGQNIDSVMSGPRTYSTFDAAKCGGREVSSARYSTCQNVANSSNIVIGAGSGAYPNLSQSYTIMNSGQRFPVEVGTNDWQANPGDKICSYSVVNNWQNINGTNARTVSASGIKCVMVTKNPQAQIRGSDSRAGGTWGDNGGTVSGGDISGISQTVDRRGSWSQYGLHSNTGTISGVGSAGQTTHNNSVLNTGYCRLIFANTSSDGLKHCPVFSGRFYEGSSLNYKINLPKEAKYTAAKISTLTSLASLPSKTVNGQRCYILDSLASGVYKAASDDMYICGSSLANGKHITIVSNGTVRLSEGGIKTASTSFSKLSDVPVFTLIAKQIIVNDYSGSSKVNNGSSTFGTYITTGDKGFTTCDVTASSQLQLNGTCSYQLMVNGAVVSKQTPMLLRTIGAGAGTVNITANGETHTDMTTAAEIFNYQPSMFLTPYALSTESGDADYKTVKQTTLPARF